MCTTIGFSCQEGMVFGRTLEIGVKLDNKILYVPRGKKDFIGAKEAKFNSKYAVLGSGFFNIASFGDGINEKGLMGSSNFFPRYASYAKEPVQGKIHMTTSNAFDFLLSRCKDVKEVREEAKNIVLLKQIDNEEGPSTDNHFFFMDSRGSTVVIEPKEGVLTCYDNPYGVLTNAPAFGWHTTNLRNYVHLRAENIEEVRFNETVLSKFGEGTGMVGLPGDFTPPSRFVRAAYFVSHTDKKLERAKAILQAFRILSQFDIPKGAIVDPIENHTDETLYTSVMDTKGLAYFIKCNENINVQPFYLRDFIDEKEVRFVTLDKGMTL